MPQLNPAPWFFIFLTSWTTLIALSLLKTLKQLPTNDPLNKQMKTLKTPWAWPWP